MFKELSDGSFYIQILLAIICGSIIGLERQVKGKPVGIRTSILICLSTMYFITLARSIDEGVSASRVLGQIVTGVGFLGAGVIMNRNDLVVGVTSASVVWLLAGMGASIGLGHYGMAIVACLVALLVLTWVQWLEKISKILQKGIYKHKKNETDPARGKVEHLRNVKR
jgi:putative Mg2+ transporter-C (MgtC) family protein